VVVEPDDEERREQLLRRVAHEYWVLGRTQAEIAEAVAFSRPSVSRLLDEARRRGVVRFAIGEPVDRDHGRERALEDSLRLVGPTASTPVVCRVVAVLGRTQAGDQRLLGRRAAHVLAGHLAPGQVLAVASSRSVAPVVASAHLLPPLGGVVELLGSGRPDRTGRGDPAGAELAAATGAAHTPVPTAFVHRSPRRAADARARSSVTAALRQGRAAHAALLGAGSTSRFDGTGAHSPVEAAVLARAARDGAVGHVLGVFLDAHGHRVPSAVDPLRVGADLDDLARLPCRVLLAYGAGKAPVIRSAVAAGLVTHLVTDADAAAVLLRG